VAKRARSSANRSDRSDARIAALSRDPETEAVDPNHHLWRNGRLWWIAFTVHRGHVQERVRFSLGTDDVVEARRRRDRVFAVYEEARSCRISLRLPKPASGPARRSRSRSVRRGG